MSQDKFDDASNRPARPDRRRIITRSAALAVAGWTAGGPGSWFLPAAWGQGKNAIKLGIATDITQRKQAEAAAKESHASLRNAIDSVSQAIVLWDGDRRIAALRHVGDHPGDDLRYLRIAVACGLDEGVECRRKVRVARIKPPGHAPPPAGTARRARRSGRRAS